MLTIGSSLVLMFASLTTSTLELPPSAYNSLRTQATEALIIEVESVKTKVLDEANTEVVVTAKVLSVERSKSGLKRGEKVILRYVHLDRKKLKVAMPGPSTIPILKQGEVYPAFLNPGPGRPDFEPAAYGLSFSMTPIDLDNLGVPPGSGPAPPAPAPIPR